MYWVTKRDLTREGTLKVGNMLTVTAGWSLRPNWISVSLDCPLGFTSNLTRPTSKTRALMANIDKPVSRHLGIPTSGICQQFLQGEFFNIPVSLTYVLLPATPKYMALLRILVSDSRHEVIRHKLGGNSPDISEGSSRVDRAHQPCFPASGDHQWKVGTWRHYYVSQVTSSNLDVW